VSASNASKGGEGPANRYPTPKKKNKLIEFIKGGGVIGAVGKKLEDASRPYNTRKRKEFIISYNTNLPPSERIDMTDEQIGSREGLTKLRNIGYKTIQDINKERQDGGNGNNQIAKVPKKILSPTSAEVSQSEAVNATTAVEEDSIYSKKKKIKAKGRSATILTSSKGVTTDDTLTLGKKSLLGA